MKSFLISKRVAHPELALELERRDVVLRLGDQEHGQEPLGKRQFGRFEHGARHQGGLVVATVALPELVPIALQNTVAFAPATWTLETRRPPGLGKHHLALCFCSVQGKKFSKRQPRLKLDPIHRHGKPPCECSPHFARPTGSPREPAEDSF